MSNDDDRGRKSIAYLLWGTITGFMAFVVALGQAFESLPKLVLKESQQWMTEFLPDLLIGLVLIGIAPLVIRRIDWKQSLQALDKRQLAAVCAVSIVAAGLLIPVWTRVREVYRVRYERAFVDWHAVRALHLFAIRRYDVAAKELAKARPTSITDLRPILQADIDARFRDADTLVKRFTDYRNAGRTLTFPQLLVAGRAARLAPQAPGVDATLSEARKIVEKALAEYIDGVAKLRHGDIAAATASLRRSKTICRELLHQELLLRYTENQDLASYTEDDRGLIAYYLHAPDERLNAAFMTYPPIRLFAPRTDELPLLR